MYSNLVKALKGVFSFTGSTLNVAAKLGIETFESSHDVIAPLAIAAQSFVIPAGCYSIAIEPFNTTIDTVAAFVGHAAFRVNTTIGAVSANMNDVIFIEQGSEPVYIGVKPADVVYFRGGTSVAGQLHVRFEG